jgi:glycosyltransferase involved in cell wall biosynthesis
LKRKKKSISSNKPKVAFVSVFGTHCGVSVYNERLINELKNYVDIKVFAEYSDESTNDPDYVVRCWSRHDHPKLKLIKEIDEWQPNLIHFGHEYGLFPKAYLFTSLISIMKSKGYPVISTLHSIYEHWDKTVHEANGQYLVAHTEAGRQCLLSKGINNSLITVIPHGTEVLDGDEEYPKLLPPLWNTWYNNHTIFQPGFLFEYKGHIKMLHVVAKLKEKYPDVHYIIQGSENPNNMAEHNRVYNEIMSECKKLDIESNVTINRGFVDEKILLSFIRTVRAVVLPYINHVEHDVYATSGVARMVISTEIPLIVSSVHLFDDINGLAFKYKSSNILYNILDNLFSDDLHYNSHMVNRIEFIKETAWKIVARKHFELYSKILN